MTTKLDINPTMFLIARRTQTGLDFLQFHREHPGFYEQFQIITFNQYDRGRRNMSVSHVFNKIRWRTPTVDDSRQYKAPNIYQPFYARMFMLDHPDMRGFFRTIHMQGETHIERKLFYEKDAA